MTVRPTCLLALVATAFFLVSCGKPAGESQSGADRGATTSQTKNNSAGPVEIVTKSGVEMVFLPSGEFMMGSSQGSPDESPPHKVRVTGFLMDKFEVTHELLKRAQLPNPSHWQENIKNPVERVRWRDAKQYCNEL